VNRLLIITFFGFSPLFSMEDAPVGRIVTPRKLRLTKLYEQLRPQFDGAGYYEVLELVSLPRLISENREYLEKLRAEQSSLERIATLEVNILDAKSIIEQLQIKFDETTPPPPPHRFSK
jgi:hypothetical protein